MLDQLLSGDRSELVKKLTGVLGVDEAKAGSFLTKALDVIQKALSSGKLDPSALLSGNLSSITSNLDLGSLAGLLGGNEAKARDGLGAIIGPLASRLKEQGGGAEGLLSQIGGEQAGGALKGIAGKLFGH